MFEFFSRATRRERAREQLLLAKSKEGDVDAVRALLEEAVDPNAKTKVCGISETKGPRRVS
jgi:hypothetical protein